MARTGQTMGSPIARQLEARRARREGLARTGKLERSEPLPAGRYWIDLFPAGAVCESCPDGTTVFNNWRSEHAETVKVKSSESFPDSDPPREWVLFEVTAPTPWQLARDIGWPTVASENVQTSSDTSSGAGPTSTWDYWFSEGNEGPFGIPNWVLPVGIVFVGVIVIAWAARSIATASTQTSRLIYGA